MKGRNYEKVEKVMKCNKCKQVHFIVYDFIR